MGELELLVLEDSEDDALLLARALQQGGLRARLHRVQTEEGYRQALQERHWNLILSDFNLPRFNGGEALRILRDQDPETPFILVSGEIGEERAADLMRRGANDFVRKDRIDRLAPAIERELREAAVRQSHREAMERLLRLGQALEQSGDGIVMADPAGRITFANAAFTDATGFAQAEALGRHPLDLLGDPTEAELHEALIEAVRGAGVWSGRFRGRRKDGEVVLLDSRISAIRNGAGDLIGFVGTHRDVTRQVEQEVHHEQGQRLEAIGTLAGGIAHDFNNLLMAIRGFAELARLRSTEPKLQDALEGILTATDRARDLVQQILAFSRSRPQERKPIEVQLVFKEALRFIRATIPSSITLRLQADTHACVLADPGELQRIVVNLCTNSVLAMRGGTGLLSVALDERVLDPEAPHGLKPGTYVRLRVADTGCGMAPEVVARIFEPFFTTRPTTGGTGMGLAVVHGLVASMEGAISVESEPGQGTSFEILLPVHAGTGGAESAKPSGLRHGRGRILFVDDERMLCEMAEEMLRNLGYTPAACTDPLEALTLLKEDPGGFDAVVTDMTMPHMTGDSLARHVHAVRPDLPVILCTGFSEFLDEARSRQLGIARMVRKPFAWGDMSRVIEEVLRPA